MADSQKTSSSRTKSAARAKPVRSAADSVYIGTGRPSKKSVTKKEAAAEKLRSKEARRRNRMGEQRTMSAADILLNKMENYSKYRRAWTALLVIAFVFMMVSLVSSQIASDVKGDTYEMLSMVVTVSLVAAYVCVFGAFFFDLIKIRPLRKIAQAQAQAMTIKAQEKLLFEFREANEAKRRAKREAKEAAKEAKAAAKEEKSAAKEAKKTEKKAAKTDTADKDTETDKDAEANEDAKADKDAAVKTAQTEEAEQEDAATEEVKQEDTAEAEQEDTTE